MALQPVTSAGGTVLIMTEPITLEEIGIKKIYHGAALRQAIDSVLEERTPLIEGFLYANCVNQVFADDGLGKSMVLLNVVLEASAGLPVFRGLPCPRPLNIIWHCAERPLDEPFERIKTMEKAIAWNPENIVFDNEIQRMDLMTKDGLIEFMIRNAELESCLPGMKTDIVVIDPIYAVTGGDLSSCKDVHTVNNIIRTVQNRMFCSVLYSHHSNRGVMFEGKRVEGDMYGNRFLSANLTGQYHLKKTDDGVELNCKKNTYGNLLRHLPLIYDEITQTLSISTDSEEFGKRDRILLFLRKKHADRKEFILREISNELKVSDAYIRKTIGPFVQNGFVINRNPRGAKATYYVEKNV